MLTPVMESTSIVTAKLHSSETVRPPEGPNRRDLCGLAAPDT
jgi:hypothetical protein